MKSHPLACGTKSQTEEKDLSDAPGFGTQSRKLSSVGLLEHPAESADYCRLTSQALDDTLSHVIGRLSLLPHPDSRTSRIKVVRLHRKLGNSTSFLYNAPHLSSRFCSLASTPCEHPLSHINGHQSCIGPCGPSQAHGVSTPFTLTSGDCQFISRCVRYASYCYSSSLWLCR